jgi:hypothetical protein
LYLNQSLDHFNRQDSRTFQQRFFVNDAYWKGVESNAPVFLCVGGEGPPLDRTVLTTSVHCTDMVELASQVGALMFALEHRYYGKSYPTFHGGKSPVTNEHLKYLSSQQALADLAYFISYIQDKHIPKNQHATLKIVTFGGSYPGMLAAWSRLKYPHLVHAAVSNSAPLQVVLDFYQYKNVYRRALSNVHVGGSEQCVAVMEQAHLDAKRMIVDVGKEEDLEYIANLFHLCNGTDALKEDRKNVDAFLGDGMVFFDVQSNDPSCQEDLCNIEKFCGNITQEAEANVPPLEILGKISQDLESHGQCKDISWERMMAFLSSEDAQVGGIRSWLWQTCTEVGFYQTCEVGTQCPFGRGHHTMDADFEICQRAFGIEADRVRENVEETLRTFGGWNISADRILSVNGDIDPWSIQSLSASGRTSQEDSERLPSYWSIGASHHYWTHAVKGTDGFGIMRTRDIIYNWVINVIMENNDTPGMNAHKHQHKHQDAQHFYLIGMNKTAIV